MSDCCGCDFKAKTREEMRVLRILLTINAVMFVVEFASGWAALSTGLLADSLDMFADAFVYGLSLYAVGRAVHLKARAAYVSGVLQILLGLAVLVEIGRRFIVGGEPQSTLMLVVGGLALAANITCLGMIYKYRKGEVHMRASYIFSANDALANLGVIVAGLLVIATSSRLPDLIVGLLISVLVLKGGMTILRESREAGTGASPSAQGAGSRRA